MFKTSDFFKSNKALELSIINRPPKQDEAEVMTNLTLTCQKVNEINSAVKKHFGLDHFLILTSGYRCLALNSAIKGSKTSQHMRGQAADLILAKRIKKDGKVVVVYLNNQILFDFIKKTTTFDQLLIERACVHFSIKAEDNRSKVGTW